MQCILKCFLKSLLLIKFGKLKYFFMHHYNGDALSIGIWHKILTLMWMEL